ncbi:peroxiredoxin, Ohr subfamily/peroxiredoxin, SACOL1771 subfamily [Carnobacterium alterfunditum]|uniref:Peroxiredoxin, Ohr subfamily/peroxiredoxin, SACOL1771 subfamily n=2 Tax=Carnobacterium alterfunditum TaxID=28230 RepID=A0A1N6I3D5_9LACT|nr:peroxiredoxin, Ohr subfamily/peroxiredoxin, SACOL1771 subfamily [Carnobacterium alterfunditum]
MTESIMTESKILYQTTAINTGGRNGESHLPDGSFSVKVSTPKQMGGPGQGSNPEQLFALGYSACFNSALEIMVKQAKIEAVSEVTAEVSLHSDPTDNGVKLSVVLIVAIEGQSLEVTKELAEKAHAFCPYSKAVQNNIDVAIKVVEYK